MNNSNQPQRNWLRILSPALVAIVFCIIGMISSYAGMHKSEGWSFIGVLILIPVVVILLVVDLGLKLLLRQSAMVIWIVELAVIAGIYLLWLARFIG